MARNRDKRRRRGGQDANGSSLLQFAAAETPAPETASVDPTEEYLPGYSLGWARYNRPLPPQRSGWRWNQPEILFEEFRQMMNDPEVSSSVRTLVKMALADGVQLQPAAGGRPVSNESADYAQASEVAGFCQRNLLGLRKPLEESLEGIVEGALTYGHKTAEITWKLAESGVDRGKLILDRIAQKDYRTLDFVVDAYWNLRGFLPRNAQTRDVIPREKFFHLALHEEDEDPRGRSSIRAIYTAWQFKCMTWPEYKRWLDNCALPSIVGKTAPKQPGDVRRDAAGHPDGSKPLSAAEAMRDALLGLKNASVAVLPNGAEVDQLEVVGEGAGFERSINIADSQISKGILYQTLATNEAQFGTRAQSQTHMGVLELLVWWLKGKIAAAIKCDLIEKVVVYNFGEPFLRLAPIVSLGDTERRDWSKDATAAASLSPVVTDSQWLAITNQLGLPAPRPGERPRREAR